MTEHPSWMKPHLRQRLEAEREARERTGPKPGENALVATDKGVIKEVVTEAHKELPPKNGLRLLGSRWREQQERDE